MPYNIPNERPEQTAWMEKCITSITGINKRTGKEYKEGEKIAICKWNLKRHDWKVPKSEEAELSMREELYGLEKKIRDAIMGPMKEVREQSGPWVVDVFDDYVIVDNAAKLFKVPYTIKGDEVSVDWAAAVEVERKTVYEPISAEREITTKVPNVKGQHRRITWGPKTI